MVLVTMVLVTMVSVTMVSVTMVSVTMVSVTMVSVTTITPLVHPPPFAKQTALHPFDTAPQKPVLCANPSPPPGQSNYDAPPKRTPSTERVPSFMCHQVARNP
jgi:hypothetical protein